MVIVKIARRVLLSLLVCLGVPTNAAAANKSPLWSGWTVDLFERAGKQNRFILLDLEAVSCHWCHVMEETTYRDPAVVDLIEARYLPVRVDQDANPDLANRYGDYGWPATIVFAPDGAEIVKRRGYISPDRFAELLRAIIEDPMPGPSVQEQEPVVAAESHFLTDAARRELKTAYLELYDSERGGWRTHQKFIDSDSMEYTLLGAGGGDARQAAMARETLDAAQTLIDPVWGGVYQYSVGPTWNKQHFEKIMSFQAQYLQRYSFAYALWKETRDLEAAQRIYRYLRDFLRAPEGAFYVSQDADASSELTGKIFYSLADSQRRAQAQPNIDRHLYARENGRAIHALTVYSLSTNDAEALDLARAAARWVLANRAVGNGGDSHDAASSASTEQREALHLGDSVYMARAFLSLYAATGEGEWLEHARRAMDFVDRAFRAEADGFMTAPVAKDAVAVFREGVRQLDANIDIARTANLLHHYTGEPRYRAVVQHTMRFLTAPGALAKRRLLPGVLLADRALAADPSHMTVVGAKSDVAAKELHAAAAAWPISYKRVEWWDRAEGPLPNADVQYPLLAKAAVFLCTNNTCSLPMHTTKVLLERLHSANG
jgi:uncharacterized protein YyaL (SSP411 family)